MMYYILLLLHLDQRLAEWIKAYGDWTYGILFVIVFCETGLVVTPFLPGDSLLFLCGAMVAGGAFGLPALVLVLMAAAVLGDTVNYQAGRYVGPKVFTEGSRWFKKKHLDRTHAFFEKYGGSTIILARFVPIVRTFAPFVAGIGAMTYWRFLSYNVVGAFLWIALVVGAGYFVGSQPWVKAHFGIVELIIILISLLPMIVEYAKFHFDRRREAQTVAQSSEKDKP